MEKEIDDIKELWVNIKTYLLTNDIELTIANHIADEIIDMFLYSRIATEKYKIAYLEMEDVYEK